MDSTPAFVAIGDQLWRLMPTHHRNRDAETGGDLQRLLEAVGAVLDDVRGTLDQRLAEIAPGARHPASTEPDDPDARVAQEWLLPYYADLLDVRLVSPNPAGQRGELQHAIEWRKGAGTVAVAGDAAGTIAAATVVVAEGRELVVTTPRVDTPLVPETALVDISLLPTDPADIRRQPVAAARHRALVPGTADARVPGRAVTCLPSHPSALRRHHPSGADVVWRHLDTRAVPCFAGSHEDPLPRTPDSRDPGSHTGLHHPARLVVYLAPPAGFFPAAPGPGNDVTFDSPERHEQTGGVLGDVLVTGGQLWLHSLVVRGSLTIDAPGIHRLDGVVVVDGPVRVADGARLECSGCALPAVTVGTAGAVDRAGMPLDPNLPGPLDATDGLVARDSLFRSVTSDSRVTVDGVTVLEATEAEGIRASETIFAGALTVTGDPDSTCIRFSRVPPALPSTIRTHAVTTAAPGFESALDCHAWGSVTPAAWDEAGCGVLDVDAPSAIRTGAEDGGELGAFHAARHAAIPGAMVEKLRDLLPVGIEPVVVLDRRLWATPPALAPPP